MKRNETKRNETMRTVRGVFFDYGYVCQLRHHTCMCAPCGLSVRAVRRGERTNRGVRAVACDPSVVQLAPGSWPTPAGLATGRRPAGKTGRVCATPPTQGHHGQCSSSNSSNTPPEGGGASLDFELTSPHVPRARMRRTARLRLRLRLRLRRRQGNRLDRDLMGYCMIGCLAGPGSLGGTWSRTRRRTTTSSCAAAWASGCTCGPYQC